MKLKSYLHNEHKHNETVTCVGWCSSEEVYSCGDDRLLLKWNLSSKTNETIAVLPADVFPTDLHCLPQKQSSTKIGHDPILLTSSDGRFHLIGKNGRIEKIVEAHRGAVLVGRWNQEGSSFLTGGEDGYVKGWSRSGLLRWSLEPLAVENDSVSIHSATWAPDANSVVHGVGSTLLFRSLTPGAKPFKVKAHDGLILALDWSPSNDLLVTGSEDCRYKVWDSFGHLLFSSNEQSFPITSVSWCPGGELFALGSYNTLKLCDKAGWSHCQENLQTGSILALSWSADGTRLVGACCNGHVILAHTVDCRLEWKNIEVSLPGKRSIVIRDVLNDNDEKSTKLEVGEGGERIVRAALGHGHLVVLTQRHCYVWNISRLDIPSIVVPIKESSSATLLLLANRNFLLWERSGPTVYSYSGRALCSPQWPTLRPDLSVHTQTVSLGAGIFAVRDQIDNTLVHLFDIGCGLGGAGIGKEMLPMLSHNLAIVQLAVNQSHAAKAGIEEDPMVAFVDAHGDLYLFALRFSSTRSSVRQTIKLGTMVTSMLWCSEWDMLAATTGSSVTVWPYPAIAYTDRRLLKRTILERESSEFGKGSLLLTSFEGPQVWLCRLDGALTGFSIPPHAALLISHLHTHSWQQALRICRTVGDAALSTSLQDLMWACLAGAAVHIGHLGTAQEAYASLEEADRVSHIQYILSITNPALRSAEMYLMAGHSVDQVEGLLVRAGMSFRAIMLNIQFCNWDRALQLAKKLKNHIEIVLYSRSKYLKKSEQKETLESFIKAMKIYEEENGSTEISGKRIKEDIQAKQEKEKLKSDQHSDDR